MIGMESHIAQASIIPATGYRRTLPEKINGGITDAIERSNNRHATNIRALDMPLSLDFITLRNSNGSFENPLASNGKSNKKRMHPYDSIVSNSSLKLKVTCACSMEKTRSKIGRASCRERKKIT